MSAIDPTINVDYRILQRFMHYRFGDDGSAWSSRVRGARGPNFKIGPWKQLKANCLRNGYPTVTIEGTKYYLHRLILEAFKGECPDGMECRHLNGNRLDSRSSNLEWGTHLENSVDTISHGRTPRGKQFPWQQGSRHFNTHINEDDVTDIRRRYNLGETQVSLAKEYGMTKSGICCICKFKSYKYLKT